MDEPCLVTEISEKGYSLKRDKEEGIGGEPQRKIAKQGKVVSELFVFDV